MNHSRLFWGIAIGAVAGVLIGGYVGRPIPTADLIGTLFLNALKAFAIPLILFSIISAITSLGEVQKLGRVGFTTVLYYLSTTAFAVLIGMVLVQILQPGRVTVALPEVVSPDKGVTFRDILLTLISPNIFESMAKMEIVPLVVFAIVFGIGLNQLGTKAKNLVEIIHILNDLILRIVRWIIYIAPIGVFGLVAARFAEAGGWIGIGEELVRLGRYAFVVLLGLVLHATLVLGALLFFVGKRNPLTLLRQVGTALLTAFSTASSSATLPVSIEEGENKAGIDPRATRFVLPLGATINMDGTALYEAVAAIFIAQLYGIDLNLLQLSIVFLMATVAAIGAAGIPEAGLVTMVLVLHSVHLPVEGIGLLLTIDWLLDRFRTTVNVWGDLVGCTLVDRLSHR